jgi:hypothetical protein
MNKGGRPRKTKGLINVAKWLPQMRRACSRQIVLDQLDKLEDQKWHSHRKKLIAQIKKDVANIQS